jgi:hypothetical protein
MGGLFSFWGPMKQFFCAILFALLGAGFVHMDAQAQVPDSAALLPPDAEVTGVLPAGTDKALLGTMTDDELTLQSGRDGEIVLDSGSATRREILSRLFAGRDVEIEWRNKAFANEIVQVRGLAGAPVELARRLLARQSYIMSYDKSSDEPRLVRIVILGSDPPSVAQSADAPVRARQQASTNETTRKRAAIDAARRAITAAQRRN